MKNRILKTLSVLFILPVIGLFTYSIVALLFLNASFDFDSYITILIIELFFLCTSTILLVFNYSSDENKYKTVRLGLWICFVLYLFTLFGILFLGNFRIIGKESITTIFQSNNIGEYIKYKTNFIPFYTIRNYMINISHFQRIAFLNIIGNIIMFCPMGILLPCLFKKTQKWTNFILTMLIGLFLIECLQLIFMMGSFDIDDIILNFTGAILVYSIVKISIIQKILQKLYLIKPGEVSI